VMSVQSSPWMKWDLVGNADSAGIVDERLIVQVFTASEVVSPMARAYRGRIRPRCGTQ
jgi:hypothetical protein